MTIRHHNTDVGRCVYHLAVYCGVLRAGCYVMDYERERYCMCGEKFEIVAQNEKNVGVINCPLIQSLVLFF